MDLLIRIHVEPGGYLWEILDKNHFTDHKGTRLYESLHLAPRFVRSESTAKREAQRFVEDKEEQLRNYWGTRAEGPVEIETVVTSEFTP